MQYNDIKILITALGSPLGQSIYKAVRMSPLVINIYGSDVSDLAAGLHFPGIIKATLPRVSDSDYLEELKNLLEREKINIIFPVLALEHEILLKNKDYFQKKNIHIVSSSLEIFGICNDKYESMLYLSARGVTTPMTVLASIDEDKNLFLSKNSFPVILKPRFGASSNDVFIVNSVEKLNALIEAFQPGYFVLQQFLSEPQEYTVGVMTSNSSGKRRAFILERNLKFGLSYSGKVIINKAIENYCLGIASELDATNSINVQLKMEKKCHMCMR